MLVRLGVVVAFLSLACDTGGTGTDVCSSGTMWTGGNEESPLMHPGMDCVGCHLDEGEGPIYTVAGTVMGAVNDPDDCYGVEGVTVIVTDADGIDHELVTNAAGNFFTNDEIPTPYTVTLDYDGAQGAMVTAQADGNCATCHTQDGANLAPGRIIAP